MRETGILSETISLRSRLRIDLRMLLQRHQHVISGGELPIQDIHSRSTWFNLYVFRDKYWFLPLSLASLHLCVLARWHGLSFDSVIVIPAALMTKTHLSCVTHITTFGHGTIINEFGISVRTDYSIICHVIPPFDCCRLVCSLAPAHMISFYGENRRVGDSFRVT
jgi:hypothetical protein